MKILRFCFTHGALATFDQSVPDGFDFDHFLDNFESRGLHRFEDSVVYRHAVQAVLLLDEAQLKSATPMPDGGRIN